MNTRMRLLVIIGVTVLALLLMVGTLVAAQDETEQGVRGNPTSNDSVAGTDQAGWRGDPPAVEQNQASAATTYLLMAGSALRPENSTLVEWKVDNAYPGCIYALSGDENQYWNAPIYPPNGATLTMLRVYYYDISAANNMEIMLGSVGEFGGAINHWTGMSSGSSGFNYIDIPIENHVVDYSKYSYLIWWRPFQLGTDMSICGIRLSYTPANMLQFLPAVQSHP